MNPNVGTEKDFLYLISRNGTLSNYEVTSDSVVIEGSKSVLLTNCKFKNLFIKDTIGGVELNSCESSLLKITGSDSNITLQDCRMKSVEVEMSRETHGSNLTLAGIKTSIEKIMVTGTYNNVNIENTAGIPRVELFYIQCRDVTVNQTENLLIKFTHTIVKKSAIIMSTKSTKVEFFETDIKHIGFLPPNDLDIDFVGCKSETITLRQGNYNSILFRGTGEFDLQFYPAISNERSTIEGLIFSDFILTNRSKIKIHDAPIGMIVISNFENDGALIFNNCVVEHSIDISDSSLGRATFNNTTIENARVSLIDSNIMDSTFTNFKWRLDYKIDEGRNIPLTALRESYRQLKANYQKNGNKIEALEFQKHEMSIHYRIAKKRVLAKPLLKNFVEHGGNFLIVGTNKWSSNFGQNIWKPLLFLFGFHLLFFNAFLFANDDLGVHAALHWDTELFFRGVRLYFQTLLPVHSTDIRIDGQIASIAGFWDFLIRVSSGYFIYYFISASRKYHQ